MKYDTLIEKIDILIKEAAEKKKPDPKAKVRNRGDCVFPAGSANVSDNKDHYPLSSEDQARSAWSYAHHYTAAPPWYKGSLESLQNAVKRKVHSKYPGIEFADSKKKKSASTEGNQMTSRLDQKIALLAKIAKYGDRKSFLDKISQTAPVVKVPNQTIVGDPNDSPHIFNDDPEQWELKGYPYDWSPEAQEYYEKQQRVEQTAPPVMNMENEVIQGTPPAPKPAAPKPSAPDLRNEPAYKDLSKDVSGRNGPATSSPLDAGHVAPATASVKDYAGMLLRSVAIGGMGGGQAGQPSAWTAPGAQSGLWGETGKPATQKQPITMPAQNIAGPSAKPQSDPKVRQLQSILRFTYKLTGADGQPLAVDGIMGKNTKFALQSYKTEYNMPNATDAITMNNILNTVSEGKTPGGYAANSAQSTPQSTPPTQSAPKANDILAQAKQIQQAVSQMAVAIGQSKGLSGGWAQAMKQYDKAVRDLYHQTSNRPTGLDPQELVSWSRANTIAEQTYTMMSQMMNQTGTFFGTKPENTLV